MENVYRQFAAGLVRYFARKRWRLARRLAGMVFALAFAAALSAGEAFPSWALSAGTYLVTMSPSYRDPETGSVEDPGNNEAIGQGMTEKLCGPSGLLEVGADGSMYLTVRYYLSQFVTDVSFEERTGGSYSMVSYEKMQVKAPVEGSSNIDEKYGYTDYRMPVSSVDSVFRGKAYIEPMGRSVVYFFTFSNPVPGSGDFITDTVLQETVLQETEIPETEAVPEEYEEYTEADADVYDEYEETETAGDEDAYRFSPEAGEPEPAGDIAAADGEAYPAGDGINGSGNADDPVTGIPQKPKAREVAQAEDGRDHKSAADKSAAGKSTDGYHLDTVYDLSDVPLEEARKLTEPMLKEAVGITGMTGVEEPEAKMGGNRLIMMALLAVAAVLAVWFGAAQIRLGRERRAAAQPEAENGADGETGTAGMTQETTETKGKDA